VTVTAVAARATRHDREDLWIYVGLSQNPEVPRCPRLVLIYSEGFSGHEEFSAFQWENVFGTGKVFMIPICT
jgi:hypothetical protein